MCYVGGFLEFAHIDFPASHCYSGVCFLELTLYGSSLLVFVAFVCLFVNSLLYVFACGVGVRELFLCHT